MGGMASVNVNLPYVMLASPAGAKMIYWSGNNTNTLIFSYTVLRGQAATAITLMTGPSPNSVAIDLLGGYAFATTPFVDYHGKHRPYKTKIPSHHYVNLTLVVPLPSDISGGWLSKHIFSSLFILFH